jgi:hypothetical protein
MQLSLKHEYFLRGRVKFPTGGKAKRRPSPRPDDEIDGFRDAKSVVTVDPV